MFLDLEEPPLKECHYAPIAASAASVRFRGQIEDSIDVWDFWSYRWLFEIPRSKRCLSMSKASTYHPFLRDVRLPAAAQPATSYVPCKPLRRSLPHQIQPGINAVPPWREH